jgi:hypothetical protein
MESLESLQDIKAARVASRGITSGRMQKRAIEECGPNSLFELVTAIDYDADYDE